MDGEETTGGVPWRRALPAGDAAVLLEFGDTVDEATNDRVQRIGRLLTERGMEGVHGAISAYATLLVEYDPLRWAPEELLSALGELAAGMPAGGEGPRRHVIPVCYGGEFGPDLAEAAQALDLDGEELAHLHAGRDYRIYCLGFSPGYPLCGVLPEEIRLPRRAVPRTEVPAGSVAIAGMQTGIYPLATAGGWHLIGRTPLTLFRWGDAEPVPYGPGDLLRFRAVDEEEFAEIARCIREGTYVMESVSTGDGP